GGSAIATGRGVVATTGAGENSGDGVPPPPNALGTTAGRGGAEATGAGAGRASGGDDEREVPGMGTLAAGKPIRVRETGAGARAAGPGVKVAGRDGGAPGRDGAIAPGRMPGISDGRIPAVGDGP